jgi:hypothetical protein
MRVGFTGTQLWLGRMSLLDKTAVAQHYSVSRRTVENWIAEGIPMQMLDGKRKGPLSEIHPWLAERGYTPRALAGTAVWGGRLVAAKRKDRPGRVYLGKDLQPLYGKQWVWVGRFSSKRERDRAVEKRRVELEAEFEASRFRRDNPAGAITCAEYANE